MVLDRQENQFASVELELWEMIRIRKDHHEPTHFIQIPLLLLSRIDSSQSLFQNNWNHSASIDQSDVDNFSLQSHPCGPPPTGEFTRPYVIDYDGLELWWKDGNSLWSSHASTTRQKALNKIIILSFSVSTAAADSGLRKRLDTHHSAVIALHMEQLTTHIGYGDWSVEENNEQRFGGTHRFGGLKYKPHHDWTSEV